MRRCLISILFVPLIMNGQLRMAKIFTNNMILQRGQPINFWGTGIPGTRVAMIFSNIAKTTFVKSDSSWQVQFPKENANVFAQSIIVRAASDTIELKNILIGDVWICSGQSNMEFPMSKEMHFKQEVNNMDQPLIRIYNPSPPGRNVYGVAYSDSLNKRLTKDNFYEKTDWLVCDSNTVKSMSAVGYYFAAEIVRSEKVPIGLINLSIGGAPVETFISREAMQKDKRFSKKVQGDWLNNESLPAWIRERGRQNVGGNVNGYQDDLGLNHAYKPGFAYACGVAPIIRMPITGVLWYQGESNSLEIERVNDYRDLMHLLINDYREKWKQPSMAFYWVQLSSIDTAKYKSQYWPQFRDEQRKLLDEVKNGGMAVCSDIGFRNDVHPANKKLVGERLARWALNKTYHRNVVPSGPLPLSATYASGRVVIRFHYTANGLQTPNHESVTGFSTDGVTATQAVIDHDKIIIRVKQKASFIYYGWKPFTDANLMNSELLPASTFKIKVQ